VLAVAAAWASVSAYIALSDRPDAQASAGMSAFGDAVRFLLVFGLAAMPATAAAVCFAISAVRTRRARARPAG
jgi:hypothetical protein